MTYSQHPYATGETAGTRVSDGEILTFLESTLAHVAHSPDYANKGDVVVCGNLVGVAMATAGAATDYVSAERVGIHNLSVVATDHRGNNAVAFGDRLFVHKTTCVISKNCNANTHLPFGIALGIVASSLTGVIAVLLTPESIDAEEVCGVADASAQYVNNTASINFREERFRSSATVGDIRGRYLRLYLSGIGVTGEALRACTSLEARAATAHGAHIGLWCQGGSVSGLGVGLRGTLQFSDAAIPATGGTYCGLMGELYFDGNTPDISKVEHSIARLGVDGNATARNKAMYLLDLFNIPSGTGAEMLKTNDTGTAEASLLVKINGEQYRILLLKV